MRSSLGALALSAVLLLGAASEAHADPVINLGAGIAVAGGSGSTLTGNRFSGNAYPAIDLGNDGRTPNDRVDADSGANGLHNFPIGVLSEKDPVSGQVKVSGVDDLADACREVAGSGFADANGNGFADVCEADMNRLQAFPNQPNGSGSSGGGALGPAKDTSAPALSKLTARPAVARRARGHRKATAATLRFAVSEASTVTFTRERVLKGRRAGKRCVTGARKGKPCVNYRRTGGSLRVNAKPGANSVKFAAKLGARPLAAGTYRLTAVAIDAAGNRSAPVTVLVSVRSRSR